MGIFGLSTIINFTPKKHKIWKIRYFHVSWNLKKSLHIYPTQQYIVSIDKKETIRVKKALNNSFLKTLILTFDFWYLHVPNVLKSGTLLSATPERHSQNRERRRSATPFYQKERCGSGTLIFEKSENMSGRRFPLFLYFFLLFQKYMLMSKFINSLKKR